MKPLVFTFLISTFFSFISNANDFKVASNLCKKVATTKDGAMHHDVYSTCMEKRKQIFPDQIAVCEEYTKRVDGDQKIMLFKDLFSDCLDSNKTIDVIRACGIATRVFRPFLLTNKYLPFSVAFKFCLDYEFAHFPDDIRFCGKMAEYDVAIGYSNNIIQNRRLNHVIFETCLRESAQ